MTIQSELALAFQFFEEKQFIESKNLYEEILEKDLTLNETIQLRYAYGYPLSALGLVEEAIENYTALEIIGKEDSNNEIISQAIHQAGMVYRQNAYYECALKKFFEEKDFIEEHFNEKNLFKSANHYELGYAYLMKDDFEEAYHFFNQSLEEAKQAEDSIMLACSQRGLGEYYIKQNNRDEAIRHLEESIQNFNAAVDFIGAYEVKQIIEAIDDN